MKDKKDKRASTMLTKFGGGEDEVSCTSGTGCTPTERYHEGPCTTVHPTAATDPASIADRVDVKLMIPRAMRDALDLAAARKYGRGRMRTMLIETVLREYLEREEPKEERGRPWGS